MAALGGLGQQRARPGAGLRPGARPAAAAAGAWLAAVRPVRRGRMQRCTR